MTPVSTDQDLARALLTGLLHDAAIVAGGVTVADALTRHRQDRHAWYRDLVGPLSCPTSRVPELLDGLGRAAGGDPVEIVLVADSGVLGVEQAKNLLLDEDGTELVGVRLALPLGGDPTAFAGRVLDALTFTVPATIDVPYQPGWQGALDVLAADGAEQVGLRADAGPLAAQLQLAAARRLRAVVGPDVRGAVTNGADPGVLNLLAAAAGAVGGAPSDAVADALSTTDVDSLVATARAVPPARSRALLGAVVGSDVRASIAALAAVGFLTEAD